MNGQNKGKLSSGQIKLLIVGAIVAVFALGAWFGSMMFIKKIVERLW